MYVNRHSQGCAHCVGQCKARISQLGAERGVAESAILIRLLPHFVVCIMLPNCTTGKDLRTADGVPGRLEVPQRSARSSSFASSPIVSRSR